MDEQMDTGPPSGGFDGTSSSHRNRESSASQATLVNQYGDYGANLAASFVFPTSEQLSQGTTYLRAAIAHVVQFEATGPFNISGKEWNQGVSRFLTPFLEVEAAQGLRVTVTSTGEHMTRQSWPATQSDGPNGDSTRSRSAGEQNLTLGSAASTTSVGGGYASAIHSSSPTPPPPFPPFFGNIMPGSLNRMISPGTSQPQASAWSATPYGTNQQHGHQGSSHPHQSFTSPSLASPPLPQQAHQQQSSMHALRRTFEQVSQSMPEQSTPLTSQQSGHNHQHTQRRESQFGNHLHLPPQPHHHQPRGQTQVQSEQTQIQQSQQSSHMQQGQISRAQTNLLPHLVPAQISAPAPQSQSTAEQTVATVAANLFGGTGESLRRIWFPSGSLDIIELMMKDNTLISISSNQTTHTYKRTQFRKNLGAIEVAAYKLQAKVPNEYNYLGTLSPEEHDLIQTFLKHRKLLEYHTKKIRTFQPWVDWMDNMTRSCPPLTKSKGVEQLFLKLDASAGLYGSMAANPAAN